MYPPRGWVFLYNSPMKSLKLLLFICLVITLIGAGVYVAQGKGLLKTPTLAQSGTLGIQALSAKDQLNLEQALTEATSQIGTLSQRSAETANTSSQVLGEFIQVNEADSEKSTSEKALEYGRYLYCQQVVKEWEEKQ